VRAERETYDRAKRQRREMSLPEVLLWNALRGKAAGGLRFRNHHPISRMTVDFYCPSAALAVEVDGEAHGAANQPERDAQRDAYLASSA
jgi:very-short-patch-repair endonuclease